MIIHRFLGRSAATDAFREDLLAFLESGATNERVVFGSYSPPVKVERTLTKILERYPELDIDRVEIEGRSGCEFYRGEATIHSSAGLKRIRFHWDCKWRAQQEGWIDYFGLPDQIRAARERGYDCFREWTELSSQVEAPAAVAV